MNVFEADFDEILDRCLARLQSGESIEQCLADFPDNDHELRPLLKAAVVVQSSQMPAARSGAVEQGQAMMLAALAGDGKEATVSFGTLRRYAERILNVLKQEEASQMRLAFRSIVTTILLIFVSGFFALTISTNSLPGDPFYPVKRGWESLRIGLTFDEDARQAFKSQIQQNRRDEMAALIELGRETQVVYEGFVEQIEGGRLIVDGFEFETNLETSWLFEPEAGDAVRIETQITDGGELVALEVSASTLDTQPPILVTISPTPCNTPTCGSPTGTPTPCNGGACGTASPTPIPSSTGDGPTPTPCNTPVCGGTTATPTPCNVGLCVTASPTPVPTSTANGPTPTPCNEPACSAPTSTPCNAGACGGPSPTPPPTSTPVNPNPTSTPCNSPVCAPTTPTPTPCTIGCGNVTPTPVPSSTLANPTPTPCNSPACAPPTPTPTPCTIGCGNPSPTPVPSSTPGEPTPTPCNVPSCSPLPTPPGCNAGVCPTATPIPSSTPCNSPACQNQGALPPNEAN